MAGCGVVGGGVLAHLTEDPRFELAGVLIRDRAKARDVDVPGHLIVTDAGALLARAPDVVVETLSDASTALSLIRAALARNVHVVSANKQAIARDLKSLRALAKSHGVEFLYSASVGGGVPMIETVRRARERGDIVRVEAVLNGTCNFILNRVAEGGGFDQAIAAARSAGFAEADSSADLSGSDAVSKLRILGYEAGVPLVEADIGRDELTEQSCLAGDRMRQVAVLDLQTGLAEVRLRRSSADDFPGDLPGAGNAIRVVLANGAILSARGRGAGRAPTAISAWADVLDIL